MLSELSSNGVCRDYTDTIVLLQKIRARQSRIIKSAQKYVQKI